MDPVSGAIDGVVSGGITPEAIASIIAAVVAVFLSLSVYRYIKSMVVYRAFKASDYFAVGSVIRIDGNNGIADYEIEHIRRTHAICRQTNGATRRRVPLADFLHTPITIVMRVRDAGDDDPPAVDSWGCERSHEPRPRPDVDS